MVSVNRNRIPRILAIIPAAIPSAIIYVVKPLVALAKRGLIVLEWMEEYRVTRERVAWCDALALIRNCEPVFSPNILGNARELNKPIIYDLDDNFWEIPIDTPDGRYLRAPERIEVLEGYLKQAALVRVYNDILREVVTKFNRQVVRLHPCIDLTLFPEEKIVRSEKARLVYSTTRDISDPLFQLIFDELRLFLTTYPEQVEAFLWGEAPLELSSLSNVTVLPIIPNYEEFLRKFSRSGFDVGLAPLISDRFHLSKTDTKFRDYGASHIAGIYSNAPVYSGSVQHGVTGLLVEHAPMAWFKAMEKLVFDSSLRKEIQENCYRFIKEHYRQEIMERTWVENLKAVLPNFEWPEAMIPDDLREPGLPRRISLEPVYEVEKAATQPGDAVLFEGGPILFGVSPEIDQAADPEQPLTHEADSIDLVVLYHTLHEGLNCERLFQDLFKISKHGAQVCVTMPYQFQKATDQARYPRLVFNENFPELVNSWVEADPKQGGARKHKTENGTDRNWSYFQPVRTEYFYFPKYRHLSDAEKKTAREQFLDVCDQVMVHFIVNKELASSKELQDMADQWDYYEPPQVTARRYQDLLETERETVADLQRVKQSAEKMSQQLEGLRSHSGYRALSRLANLTDYSKLLGAKYQQLLDDSLLFGGRLEGYRLMTGVNLQGVAFVDYTVELQKPNLSSVLIAPWMDLPQHSGILGLEIYCQQEKIRSEVVALGQIDLTIPLQISFEPIPGSNCDSIEIRIFVQGADRPVRILEWKKYAFFGLGILQRKPFMGFDFSN